VGILAEEDNKQDKNKKLGSYLVVSRGVINNAVESQITSYTTRGTYKPIGEILVEQGVISKEELENSLRNQRMARLAGCPVFASLSRSELGSLCKYFTEVQYGPGETFIMQGEDDPTLYVIATGQVEVFRLDNTGEEIPIAIVGEGEPIGEMGYFSGEKRSACVRTLDPCLLLRAEYKNLTRYFEDVPRVAHAFMQVINHRKRELDKITSINE
jgi:hypothetical protein